MLTRIIKKKDGLIARCNCGRFVKIKKERKKKKQFCNICQRRVNRGNRQLIHTKCGKPVFLHKHCDRCNCLLCNKGWYPEYKKSWLCKDCYLINNKKSMTLTKLNEQNEEEKKEENKNGEKITLEMAAQQKIYRDFWKYKVEALQYQGQFNHILQQANANNANNKTNKKPAKKTRRSRKKNKK